MAIRFQCKCGKSFKVAEQFADKRTRCTNCGVLLLIPGVQPPKTKPPAAPPPKPPHPPKFGHPLETAPQPSPEPPAPQQLDGWAPKSSDIPSEAVGAPRPKLELTPVSQATEPPASPPLESDASGELLLEVERFGVAGKTEAPPAAGDKTLLATGPASAPSPGAASAEPFPVEPQPGEPAGLPAGAGAKCPKCGEPTALDAVICLKCGASETAAPPAGVAEEKPGPLTFLQLLRKRKEFPLIAAGAAVLVIGLVVAGVVLVRKSHKKSRLAAVAKQAQQQAPLRPPPPKVEEKPKPPPEAEIRWSGFSDPSTVARDRILKTGRDLLDFLERTHRPAETLAEAGIPESESAAYAYVGPEVAALNRFRVLLYEAKPDSAGRQWAFFSDGSARHLPSAVLPQALLDKTAAGWLTASETALLATIAPQVRIANVRFPSLEVALDGKPAGTIPQGKEQTIQATAGAHQLSFMARGQTDALDVNFEPGVVYIFVHPRCQDIPSVPVRQYRAALLGQPSSYTTEREGLAVKGLRGPNETVTFLGGDGRSSLSLGLRWLDARIVRDQVTIEGFDNKRILVSEIGRLEVGALGYKNDLVARFRKTSLGTLRSDEVPNMEVAALAMSEGGEAKPPGQKSGQPAPGVLAVRPGAPPVSPEERPGFLDMVRPGDIGPLRRDMQMPRPDRLRGGEGMLRPRTPLARGAASSAASPLCFPVPTFLLSPDCQTLADVLSSAAPSGIQELLARIQRAQELAGGSRSASVRGRGMPESPGERMKNLALGGPGRSDLRERDMGSPEFRGRFSFGGPPSFGPPPVAGPPLMPPEIQPNLLYGALAVYGDPSTLGALSSDYEKMNAASPGFPELLLALARSGRGLALAQLRAAAAQDPAHAAIALCMVDDPAARKALAEVVAAWSNQEVLETLEAWPALAGPTSRITFVETLASANPELLDDTTALNALMKLEPYTLERALAERLKAEFAPPLTPAAPTTQTEPGSRGGEGPMFRGALPFGKGGAKTPAELREQFMAHGGQQRGHGEGELLEGTMGSGAAAPATAAPPYWLVLAHFRNTAAVAQFVEVLGGKDSQKRQQAVAALAAVQDASVVPVLAEALKENDPPLRRAAAKALIETGDSAVVPILDAAMDKDLLLTAIVEQAPSFAAKAGAEPTAALLAKMLTFSLQEKKAPEAKPRAAQAPQFGPNQKTAPESAAGEGLTTPQAILAALVRLGHRAPAVSAAIESARKNAEPALRAAAFQASARLAAGDSPAERSLALTTLATEAMKDPEATVRAAGIDLLQGVEAQAAIAILETAAKDADPKVRATVMNAVAGLAGDDERLSKMIAGALNDPDAAVVSAAARAAARRKDTAMGPALLAALNQAPQRGNDKTAALPALAEAAGILQVQGVASSLILLLANTQPQVRAAAAHALGALKDPTAAPSLVSAAQDKDRAVLAAVIAALSEFDSPDAVQGVLDTLKRTDLPLDLRQQILSRLVSRCAESNPYGDWVTKGPPLNEADLDFLASAAPSAPPSWQAGMMVIARRYLADTRTEVRKRAANILASYADDASAQAMLLGEFERDASGIGQAVAEALSHIHDAAMIERPLLNYYRQLCELAPGSGGSTAFGQAAPMGSPAGNASAAAGGPQIPGLAKASAEENAMLRAAIIKTIGEIGGADAVRALHRIALLEQSRNSEEMTPFLIAALERAKSPDSVRFLCEYAARADSSSALAIAALGRVAQVHPGLLVTDTLQRLILSPQSPPDIAAAAADTLEDIKNANPQPG